ncbi:MAG: hypothetical protein M1828_001086 [Chrysothrix sp. TS-e1954]|nr:MAG: hypothetical protein M1828_001086 [Chrysothrix sp. TS-e1954]
MEQGATPNKLEPEKTLPEHLMTAKPTSGKRNKNKNRKRAKVQQNSGADAPSSGAAGAEDLSHLPKFFSNIKISDNKSHIPPHLFPRYFSRDHVEDGSDSDEEGPIKDPVTGDKYDIGPQLEEYRRKLVTEMELRLKASQLEADGIMSQIQVLSEKSPDDLENAHALRNSDKIDLPNPGYFPDGPDPYMVWRRKAIQKLQLDGDRFRSDKHKAAFLFSFITGTTARELIKDVDPFADLSANDIFMKMDERFLSISAERGISDKFL